MGALLLPWIAAAVLPQGPGPMANGPDSGLLLLPGSTVTAASFQLGVGGVAAADGAPECVEGGCRTPGGITVECRPQGVLLRFPTGRQLLFAPDGFLHLRAGGVAGPFALGVELRLGDGVAVRVEHNGSRRAPLAQVMVLHDGAATRIWRHRGPVLERAGDERSFADRLWCLGEGDSVYRAIALGPLITVQRVLAPGNDELPAARLLLLVEPVLGSMTELLAVQSARHRRQLGEIADAAARGTKVFAPTPALAPPRLRTDPPRYVLPGNYQLQFERDGVTLLMGLCRGERRLPFVQWRLGYAADVRQVVVDDQPGTVMSRPVRLPAMLPELAARVDRDELVVALAAFGAIGR